MKFSVDNIHYTYYTEYTSPGWKRRNCLRGWDRYLRRTESLNSDIVHKEGVCEQLKGELNMPHKH